MGAPAKGKAMTYRWLRSQTHAALEDEVNESKRVRVGERGKNTRPFKHLANNCRSSHVENRKYKFPSDFGNHKGGSVEVRCKIALPRLLHHAPVRDSGFQFWCQSPVIDLSLSQGKRVVFHNSAQVAAATCGSLLMEGSETTSSA